MSIYDEKTEEQFTTGQKKFVANLSSVHAELGAWAKKQFETGFSLSDVRARLAEIISHHDD